MILVPTYPSPVISVNLKLSQSISYTYRQAFLFVVCLVSTTKLPSSIIG